MARLLVHVEGQTEERFVNELLRPHLKAFDYEHVSARLIGNSRQRDHRGGIVHGWPAVRQGIVNHLRQDPRCLVTTMIDFYGLPREGPKAWPGRDLAARKTFAEKPLTVEHALCADIALAMGTDFNPKRFLPFVVMHEFEALLFSDCEQFAQGIQQAKLARSFGEIRAQFRCPEEINDSPQTAPSKRVEALVQGYQKPLLGAGAAERVGLASMRKECPHFRDWLTQLESWPATQ